MSSGVEANDAGCQSVVTAISSAPSGNPARNAHAIVSGMSPPSPLARAAIPDTPAMRPKPSNITAPASPISRPPINP